MNRCGHCPATWTGANVAHCGGTTGCHRTFSAPSTFDRHRDGHVGSRVCLDPTTVGLQENAFNVFRTPTLGAGTDDD